MEPHDCAATALSATLTARLDKVESNHRELKVEQASLIEIQDNLIEELQDILRRHTWTSRGLCIECSGRNPAHHPDCGLAQAMRS